jgi:NADPH:quinone reductase-like Zn-dependent oxidoreductase
MTENIDSRLTTTREAHTSTAQTAMRAVVRDRFGPPGLLEHTTTNRPTIADDEVLVRVHAAGVNQGDVLEMRGWPYIARLISYGALRPKCPILGTDIAGRVVAVGNAVSRVGIGDAIVGWGRGAFAEFAALPADSVTHKPAGLTFEQAAALPTAGVAALQAVRDAGRVRDGHHALIVGASGGVGTFAVQLAKIHRAEVTATCSARNVELVRSLGADHTIDYTAIDVTNGDGRYDVIIDLVGDRPLRAYRRVLTEAGRFVVVGGRTPRSITGMTRFAAASAISPFVSQHFVPLISQPNHADLYTLTGLVRAGRMRPIVDQAFMLADTPTALHHIETGHTRGKVVLTV